MTAPYFHFPADSLPVPAQRRMYADYGKRLFDLAALVLMAPVILPVVFLLVGLVTVTGTKPFYAQERVGRDGRTFRCWKIRTMVADADAALARLLKEDPALAEEWAVNQKLARDPRITLMGRFLRKTSLDELPQLWNVLRGEMSLVGPRPFTPDQRDIYPSDGLGRLAYFAMRPGITGLWQVSRRNRGSFAERAYYDSAYEKSLSFLGDLRIIFLTAAVVLSATGV